MPSAPDFLQPHQDGVHFIDTGFHRARFDASYLLVQDGRAAFVDTGTNHAVPRLLAALAALGLRPHDVDWVIPTHAHLDHAGGVGLLLTHLPRARVLAHPRAARHLIDPTRLVASAQAVYGEAEMARSYGTLVPVPAQRLDTSHDGMALDWRGRRLVFLDTPGHARHHHCVWDETTRGWFTGDTFGLSYREFDTPRGPWLFPTATPVQFEPEKMRHSVERLLEAAPRWLYLTHYGPLAEPGVVAHDFGQQIDELVSVARTHADAPDRHAALRRALTGCYLRRVRAHGVTLDDATVLDLLEIDIELNAQGLGIWIDHTDAPRTAAAAGATP